MLTMDKTRDRSKSFSNKNEILFIGDQLRLQMNYANLKKDRKYHFKTYRDCFVGKEAVSWLLECKFCDSRSAAVHAFKIMQENYILHHVCDDHSFKDEMLFYRFRFDDGTFETDIDMNMFHKGQKIYRQIMAKKKGMIKTYQLNTHLFHDAFIGSTFVDWLMTQEGLATDEAISLGRKLLDYNIIRHVTDDHHFRNDNCLLYQFAFNFDQKFVFQNIYRYSIRTYSRNFSDSSLNIPDIHRKMSNQSEKSHSSSSDSHDEQFDSRRLSTDQVICSSSDKHSMTSSERDSDSDCNTETNDDDSSMLTPRSVLLRYATVTELESPDTPYIKRTIRNVFHEKKSDMTLLKVYKLTNEMTSDSVGYGFVVRGDGPTYVQTIDPTGPAAAAGLKVRQYIHSVNGINVLRNNHKEVAKKIMDVEQYLNLSVMVHKRDALFNEIDWR